MIRNIVFDLGRVLLTYEPRKYLERLYDNPIRREYLMKGIFGSQSWKDLDQGIIDEQEAYRRMSAAIPVLSEDVQYILDHWDDMLAPIEENIRLMKKLKKQNYGLYLISNFHRRAYDRVYHRYSFFGLFDGILISSHVKLLKPDPAIFLKLLQDYSLLADTCLFIDDLPENVSGAQSVGMAGLVFQSPQQLERELCTMGILES